MSNSQQQQKLSECRNCKANGFPNQQIAFKNSGQLKDDGSIKWTVLNPDLSLHQHKKQADLTQAQTPAPTINMSESQKASVHDFGLENYDEKQIYYKERQEERDKKYDDNIKEYKQWQSDILKEAKYQSTILEDILTSQKEQARDTKDILRIVSTQTQEPTIQKASDLVLVREGQKSSQAEQEKAFENLDNATTELAQKIEQEIKEEQQKGYPE